MRHLLYSQPTDGTHFIFSPWCWYSLYNKERVFLGTTIPLPQIESWLASVVFDLGQDLICVFMCSSGAGTAKPSGPQRMFANWTHLFYLPSVNHANQKLVHFWPRVSLFRLQSETPRPRPLKKNEARKPMLTTVKRHQTTVSCRADPQLMMIVSTSKRVKLGIKAWSHCRPPDITGSYSIYTAYDSGLCYSHLSLPTSLHAHIEISTQICLWWRLRVHGVCDRLSQVKVTSFNANAVFSPLLMSRCDS